MNMKNTISEIGLPEGTMSLRQFASMCRVPYEKAYYHAINHSSKHYRQHRPDEYFDVTEIKKPYSTRLYLTPEQQGKALAYWVRYSIPHSVPTLEVKHDLV
jgi:hypothetical protein